MWVGPLGEAISAKHCALARSKFCSTLFHFSVTYIWCKSKVQLFPFHIVIVWDTTGRPRCNFSSRYLPWFDKGRTIGKVMGDGEVGKKQKKIKQGKMSPNKFIQSEPQRKKKSWKGRARYFTKTRMILCLPETFLARFPVSVMSSFIVPRAKRVFSRSSAARSCGLWPTRKIPATRKTEISGTQGTRMTTSFGGRGRTSAWTREEKTKLEID